jgi:hypothetical protein
LTIGTGMLPAMLILAIAGAGCSGLAGASGAPVSLAEGLIIMPAPRGFEATVEARRPGSLTDTVSFRGPARRRGDFNQCSVSSVRIEPATRNALSLAAFVAGVARERHAAYRSTDGLHDVSISEPASSQTTDPWVVRSSFTIDYTLRTVERFWGVPSAAGDFLITQHCQTGGSAEELAAIVEATRPIAD